MRALLSAVLVLSQAVPQVLAPAGGLEVVAHGDQVSVRAHGVPVSRILDRLAQQTGMKVTYESSPPSQPVTATLEDLPVREAVVRLLEGLGVGYVFRTDASGQRVETLIVSGGAASGTSTASVASQPNAMEEYPAEVVQEVPEYEPPPEVQPAEMAPPQPGMPAPDLALPGMPAYQGLDPNYPKPPQYPGGISFPN